MEWREIINRGGRTASFSLFILLSCATGISIFGQGSPSKLLSLPVYHPMVLNPAFAGSKDFTSISLTTKASKWPDTQILNLNTRLYSPDGEFSHLGIGAYVFQEQFDLSWNTGLAVSGAYHFSLDRQKLHYISLGTTLKGILAVPKASAESPADSLSAKFRPNMDIGVYYYGPQAFGGIAVTTMFGTDTNGDSTLNYSNFDRQYNFQLGYKFLISKRLGIVIEPSILATLDDETIGDPINNLVPYLKVYLNNFYVGSYLKDLDIFALFFQYQFPKFYAGVFLEFPTEGYLNDENIIFEVSMGMNLGRGNPTFNQHRHW
jgi:type IX secretion system PorP/SprF family membrane protein